MISVMMPSVPSAPTNSPGQVVARARFARAPAGADQAAVGGDHLQRQHVVAHRPVAHRHGAGGAGRRHPADRGVGAGIDRKEQAGVRQRRVELLAGDAGCTRSRCRRDVRRRRYSSAEKSTQTPPLSAETLPSSEVPAPNGIGPPRAASHSPHDRRDFVVRVREHDDVGQSGVGKALAVAVLVAHRRAR